MPPFTITSQARPANPASGGHYVNLGGNVWQQIHAIGPGKWAPGPVAKAPAAKAPAAKAPAADPFSNPLYNPGAALSGKPLYQAVTALTNATYNPELTAIKQQIAQRTAQGTAQQSAAGQYFNQLGQYGQQAAQDAAANSAALNTRLDTIGQNAQSALGQLAAAGPPPALASLQSQGLGAGTGTDYLASLIAAAKNRLAQSSAVDQAYGAKVGTNAANLSAQNLGAYALGGQQALGKIGTATQLGLQPLTTQLATDTAKKAAAFSTNLMAARAAERNWAATQQGLQLHQEAFTTPTANAVLGAQTSAANAALSAATSTANNKRTTSTSAANTAANIKSRQDIAAENNAVKQAIADGKAAAKKNQPAPPGAQRTIWNSITKVQGTLRNLVNTIQKWPGATPASAKTQAWHALNTGQLYVPQYNKQGKLTGWAWQKITPVGDTGILNAAYNTALPDSGGLTPGDVSYLHNMGFTIGTKMPIQPAKIGGYTPAQLQQAQTGITQAVSKLK